MKTDPVAGRAIGLRRSTWDALATLAKSRGMSRAAYVRAVLEAAVRRPSKRVGVPADEPDPEANDTGGPL